MTAPATRPAPPTIHALTDPTVTATVARFVADRDLVALRLPGGRADHTAVDRIGARVAAAGFCLLDTGARVTNSMLLTLAADLGLGRPFIPPVYRTGTAVPIAADGVSRLRATETAAVAHPATDTAAQPWHTDGTVQPLGQVRTTLLGCVVPAATGGHSLLLAAGAALLDLAATDPAAAEILLHPGILTRHATVNGSTDSCTGPAFAVHDQILLTRYARTRDAVWTAPPGRHADLQRALAAMAARSEPGSAYRLEFTLTAGQVVVFDNARVCHARTAYTDGPARRTLLRALFTNQPRRT